MANTMPLLPHTLLKKIPPLLIAYTLPVILFTLDHNWIFPELFALIIGLLIAPQTPWRTTRLKTWIGMIAAASLGVAIVNLLGDCHLSIQLLTGILGCAGLLNILQINVIPLVPGCILPVVLHHSNPIYILSVAVFCGILLLANAALRPAPDNTPIPRAGQAIRWLVILLVLSPVLYLAIEADHLFLITPPVIVAFVAFLDKRRPIRNHYWVAVVTFAVLSTIGSIFFTLLSGHHPLWQIAALITAVVILFYKLAPLPIKFPPPAASALLVLLLPQQAVWLYPLEVTASAAILLALARYLSRKWL